MSLKDAEVMALSTLKEVMEEKVLLTHSMWHSSMFAHLDVIRAMWLAACSGTS